MSNQVMRAVNYQGPFSVKVQEVEMPKLEHPDDVIVKVTTVSHSKSRDTTDCLMRSEGRYLRI